MAIMEYSAGQPHRTVVRLQSIFFIFFFPKGDFYSFKRIWKFLNQLDVISAVPLDGNGGIMKPVCQSSLWRYEYASIARCKDNSQPDWEIFVGHKLALNRRPRTSLHAAIFMRVSKVAFGQQHVLNMDGFFFFSSSIWERIRESVGLMKAASAQVWRTIFAVYLPHFPPLALPSSLCRFSKGKLDVLTSWKQSTAGSLSLFYRV